MLQSVRISSKRQITIPSKFFLALGLSEGDNLVVQIEDNKLVMQKSQALLDEVAGSLTVPDDYKGKSLDYIIRDAGREYLKRKK